MMRRGVIAVLLLLVMPLSCLAAEGRGYIRLTMVYDGRPVPGGTVAIYDISNFSEEASAEELADFAVEAKLPGEEKKVNSEGIALFDDLAPGRYLLVQQRAAEGFYPMRPFCIRLNESANGAYVDGIDASPKMEPEGKLPQTGQLIWPAWLLVGIGAALAGVGLWAEKRNKQDLQES